LGFRLRITDIFFDEEANGKDYLWLRLYLKRMRRFIGGISLPASYADVPIMVTLLIGTFNAVQGVLTVLGGYIICEAIKRRVPSLVKK